MERHVTFENSTGNVFEDIGLANAQELNRPGIAGGLLV
jgi:hypothetical protein